MDIEGKIVLAVLALLSVAIIILFYAMCQVASRDDDLTEEYIEQLKAKKEETSANTKITKGEKTMEDSKKIKIKYFDDEIEKLKCIDGEKSDWIDLRAAEKVVMDKGDFKLIPLGIAMKLPKGYEAHVVPRSSTFKNFGIIQTNHQAVIDESYCGDNDQWFYPALAMRPTTINKNDRICQFRIMKKMPPIEFEEVDKMEDEDRGGIGSTGVN